MLEMFIDKRSTLNNISCVFVFWVAEIVGMYAYSSICRRDVHIIIVFLFILFITLHPRDSGSLIHPSWYDPRKNSLGEESQARLSSTGKNLCQTFSVYSRGLLHFERGENYKNTQVHERRKMRASKIIHTIRTVR